MRAAATVRIKEETRTALRELANETNEPMQDLLGKAVEAYRRQRILELTNEAYAALRGDPQLWQEVEQERRALEGTLGDGLEPE